jgi:hypothetical protein
MKRVNEDQASTGAFNSAGGGGVDGIGIGPEGEPGVPLDKKRLKKRLRQIISLPKNNGIKPQRKIK